MPSHAHQTLLLWGARRMSGDGFDLGGFEGPAVQAGIWNSLPPPFDIHGIRPDAWGLRQSDSLIGFVEAKTERDVDTEHTRVQLRVLGFTRMRDAKTFCPLYIAVPRSAAYALDRVLIDVDLITAPQIKRLHIPDALLKEPGNDSRETYNINAVASIGRHGLPSRERAGRSI